MRRRPMPSLRDPKLGVLAVSPPYLADDRVLPSSGAIRHCTIYDATMHSGWGSTAFQYAIRNQKSICDGSERCPVRGHPLIGPND